MVVHRGRWTLRDRAENVMRAVPVTVAPGTAALTVRLDYPRADGVLDLGCVGPAGFRGWSGGVRDGYTVAADWATPGYLPGELEPGEWHVLLRLHRVPPQGLDFEVTATTSTSPPAPPPAPEAPPRPERPPRRAVPEVDGRRWLAGDLHAHTVHSDGAQTIDELAALAVSRRLDFLAVTDHNTVSHHPWLADAGRRYGITLVPGQEVTTDRGHANVFGPVGWVDFRQPPDEWLATAERAGGLMSINHPLSGDCAWRQPVTTRTRFVEVWHSSWWDRTWGAPLAWAQAWRPDVVPIGGSDYHRPGADALPGAPTTWVLTDGDPGDEAAVREALGAGRTAISAGPDAPLLLRLGDELLALDADGALLGYPDGSHRVVRGDRCLLPAGDGLHVLESHRMEVIALCS
ncbi:Predicted metal-dependent phosphoesterase TrpH, contains PHP domain [Micromonospora rhizosphaerae]|uniref:Predicted metal-dependent phosphoesterase TrpH, contains PHP domain n=1 Tax=Micromonospora rhizosphaerae TaxID=568872 RepID=A0A1C6SIP4_9ACTN|nr:CehA/McbA family metallohydrolase [Micromonospora rhizosphaerae]SCL29356.1 Predicted metal-dependent phosphoesterase TrpH, contains PHP domain [Micromonospora rhizosphaerae]